MALTPQPLMRAQDTVATTYLGPITPKNWRIKSTVHVPIVDANPVDGNPRYNQADYIGGVKSSDQGQATANVAVARADGAPAEPDYAPRMQPQKATILGTVAVGDIGRNPGTIAPAQPYPDKNTAALPAPTITTLAPATAAAGAATPQFAIKITGTGFTPYSTVSIGGSPAPSSIYTYVSPTEMRCQMSPAASVPGTITVTVTDHGVTTAAKNFTWT
jgi:hypothetical protein